MKNGLALRWHLQEALRPKKPSRATAASGRNQPLTW